MNTSLTLLERSLLRFAEPATTHLRRWTLPIGVLGVTVSLLTSFTSAAQVVLPVHLLLGATTFFSLVVGVGCLARFVLDSIMTVRARRAGRPRTVAPTTTVERVSVQASIPMETPAHLTALTAD